MRSSLADTWHEAMRRARTLDPSRITAHIVASANTGLCAVRFDTEGSRTTSVPCDDPERCDEGPWDHSHHIARSDPTGNAAVSNSTTGSDTDDLRRLSIAHHDFLVAAGIVLDWVSGKRPTTWAGVLMVNARLMPGTVQAGLDVDDTYALPPAIRSADRAVSAVASIARDHLPRDPSQDEKHWTAGLADEDCCAWHLEIHRRYRRPRMPGKNICQSCCDLAILGGTKPPRWIREAEVDREGKPKMWQQSLGRWLDELGVDRAS